MLRAITFFLLFTWIPTSLGAVAEILGGYQQVASALAADELDEAGAAAEALASELEAYLSGTTDGNLATALAGARAVEAADTEDAMRTEFSGLSKGVLSFVKAHPEFQSDWQAYKCPMAPDAYPYWMQPVGESMANPYMGLKMLQCGMKKSWNKLP